MIDCGWRSAGVLVAARKHIAMRRPIEQDTVPDQLGSRFGLKRSSPVCHGGSHLGSVYLTSSIGVKAKRNMYILDSLAAVLRSLNCRWTLGGISTALPRRWRPLVGFG